MKILAFLFGMAADAIAALHLFSETKTDIGPWAGAYGVIVLLIIILCGGITGVAAYNALEDRIKRKEHDRFQKHLGRR